MTPGSMAGASPFLHPFLLLPRRFKHCASHVYIAHFIDQQQQQQRFALFQQHQAAIFASHQAAAVAAATGKAPAALPQDVSLAVKTATPVAPPPPATMLSATQMAYAQQMALLQASGAAGHFPNFATAAAHFPSGSGVVPPGYNALPGQGGGRVLTPLQMQQLQAWQQVALQQQHAARGQMQGASPVPLPPSEPAPPAHITEVPLTATATEAVPAS